jgi:hypothetical protein
MSQPTQSTSLDEKHGDSSLNTSTIEKKEEDITFPYCQTIFKKVPLSFFKKQKEVDLINSNNDPLQLSLFDKKQDTVLSDEDIKKNYDIISEKIDSMFKDKLKDEQQTYQLILDVESGHYSKLIFEEIFKLIIPSRIAFLLDPCFVAHYLKFRDQENVTLNYLINRYKSSLSTFRFPVNPKNDEVFLECEQEFVDKPIYSITGPIDNSSIRSGYHDSPLLKYTDIYAKNSFENNYYNTSELYEEVLNSLINSITKNNFSFVLRSLKQSFNNTALVGTIKYVDGHFKIMTHLFKHFEMLNQNDEEIYSYNKDYAKEICQCIFKQVNEIINCKDSYNYKDEILDKLSKTLFDCFEITINMSKQNMFLLKILLKNNLFVTDTHIQKAILAKQPKSIIKLLEKHKEIDHLVQKVDLEFDEVEKEEDHHEIAVQKQEHHEVAIQKEVNTNQNVTLNMNWITGSFKAILSKGHIEVLEKEGGIQISINF